MKVKLREEIMAKQKGPRRRKIFSVMLFHGC